MGYYKIPREASRAKPFLQCGLPCFYLCKSLFPCQPLTPACFTSGGAFSVSGCADGGISERRSACSSDSISSGLERSFIRAVSLSSAFSS